MATIDKIKTLTKQLFPTGRAFWMPVNGSFEKLMNALNASEARAYDDAVTILNDILPDNPNFTSDDASQWEKRLGLITNTTVSLFDRKLAIKRKMNHPGTIKARQNYRYLQAQLRAAGFDVYVYENRFPDYYLGYVTKTPTAFSLLPYPIRYNQYGDFQYGQQNYGGTYGNKIVNNVDESLDYSFSIGANLRSTFFIGGPTPGSWAVIPANRKDEFRQLVLKLKRVSRVAFLLINFY
jgi:hypothetical protein